MTARKKSANPKARSLPNPRAAKNLELQRAIQAVIKHYGYILLIPIDGKHPVEDWGRPTVINLWEDEFDVCPGRTNKFRVAFNHFWDCKTGKQKAKLGVCPRHCEDRDNRGFAVVDKDESWWEYPPKLLKLASGVFDSNRKGGQHLWLAVDGKIGLKKQLVAENPDGGESVVVADLIQDNNPIVFHTPEYLTQAAKMLKAPRKSVSCLKAAKLLPGGDKVESKTKPSGWDIPEQEIGWTKKIKPLDQLRQAVSGMSGIQHGKRDDYMFGVMQDILRYKHLKCLKERYAETAEGLLKELRETWIRTEHSEMTRAELEQEWSKKLPNKEAAIKKECDVELPAHLEERLLKIADGDFVEDDVAGTSESSKEFLSPTTMNKYRDSIEYEVRGIYPPGHPNRVGMQVRRRHEGALWRSAGKRIQKAIRGQFRRALSAAGVKGFRVETYDECLAELVIDNPVIPFRDDYLKKFLELQEVKECDSPKKWREKVAGEKVILPKLFSTIWRTEAPEELVEFLSIDFLLKPFCHVMDDDWETKDPYAIGLQGATKIGKSETPPVLLPKPYRRMYKQGFRLEDDPKVGAEKILNSIYVEVAEGKTKKGDDRDEIIKSWLLNQFDTIRLAYAEDAEDLKKTCLFVFTLNFPFVSNEDSVRRRIIQIKVAENMKKPWKWLAKNRDRLWMEAAMYWTAHKKQPKLTNKLRALAEKEFEGETQVSQMERDIQRLYELLKAPDKAKTFGGAIDVDAPNLHPEEFVKGKTILPVNVPNLCDTLKGAYPKKERFFTEHAVGQALYKLGFVKEHPETGKRLRMRGTHKRYWFMLNPDRYWLKESELKAIPMSKLDKYLKAK